AVAGDVDAGLRLTADRFANGALQRSVERFVEGIAAVLRKQKVHDVLRTREAAHVCRQSALGAGVHIRCCAASGALVPTLILSLSKDERSASWFDKLTTSGDKLTTSGNVLSFRTHHAPSLLR